MEPYWTDGERTIYYGDCLEVLPGLEAASVDLILTDPPYGCPPTVTKWSPRQGPKSSILRPISEVSWDRADWSWIRLLPQLLSETGSAITFCRLEDLGTVGAAFESAHLKMRGSLLWLKTNPIPRGAGKVYASAVEAMAWAARTGYWWSPPRCSNERWNVIMAPHESQVSHASQKPRAVIRGLLRTHCPPDGLILDPFLGSGTTLVVAKELGLRAIGIELNDTEQEPYCRIARKRIERTQKPELVLPLAVPA
jgi:DNA modification methylase